MEQQLMDEMQQTMEILSNGEQNDWYEPWHEWPRRYGKR